MKSAIESSYRKVAANLRPQAVSEYLALSSWTLEHSDEAQEIWQLAGVNGKMLGRLMLPLEDDYSDYGDRFYDALIALARVNDWDADQLQESIRSIWTDLFFLRLNQATPDGTIPFSQAESTIRAMYKIFRSAANATALAEIPRKSMQRTAVKNLLDYAVRLGHTKRGSFTFTIAARLGNGARLDKPMAGIGSSLSLLPRRVMETIAVDLEALAVELNANRVVIGEADDYFGAAAEDAIVSTTLLESLEEIIKPEEVQSVELSFKWAIAGPPPAIATMDPLRLNQDSMTILSRLRARPQRELIASPNAIASRQAIVGPVFSIAPESDEDGGQSTIVVAITDLSTRRPRQVSVTLGGINRDLAIRAYESRLPLKALGYLGFEARKWRLVGQVEISILDVEDS